MARLVARHSVAARLTCWVAVRNRAWSRSITRVYVGCWEKVEQGVGQLRLGKECKKLRGLKSLLDHDSAENCSGMQNELIEVFIPYKEVVSENCQVDNVSFQISYDAHLIYAFRRADAALR